MRRPKYLKFLPVPFFLFVIAVTGCMDESESSANKSIPGKPNILLILTDDQGYPTTGHYGGEIVPTPHLDRLAAEGMLFTDAYVTSQCTPTRATLLTGQYTARHRLWHVLSWYGYPWARMTEPAFAEDFPRSTFTLARGLQKVGYVTGIVGKWHLTSNADGDYMGLNPEAASYYGFDYAPPVLSRDEFDTGADRGVNTLTEQAVSFIEVNRDRPWFCFLSHHTIHGVVVAPETLTQKYRDRGYGDNGPYRAVYLAALEHLDHSIGRIMQHLDESDEADETLIVFLSDNGGIYERLAFKDLPVPNPLTFILHPDLVEYENTPFRAGKGSMYEGGVRVPMIVRWPGYVTPGSVSETPVHAVDIAPTLFDIAGATSEHELDGVSLSSLFRTGDPDELADRPIFQYYPFYDLRWALTPCATIRLGDFKLIEFFGDRFDETNRYVPGHHIELYNLREDPGEQVNLATIRPERASGLRQLLHDWMSEISAPIPEKNTYFDPARAFVETKEKPDWLK